MHPYYPYLYYYMPWNMSYYPNYLFSNIQNKNINFRNPFPPANPARLTNSAQQMKNIIDDVNLILNKLVSSQKFSVDLITAAQQSKKEIVVQMLRSTGIKRVPKVVYTPDGISLLFDQQHTHMDCCDLVIKLRW